MNAVAKLALAGVIVVSGLIGSAAAAATILTYEAQPADANAKVDLKQLVRAIERRLTVDGKPLAKVKGIEGGRIEVRVRSDNADVIARVEKLLSIAGTLQFRILAAPNVDKAIIARAENGPDHIVTGDGTAEEPRDRVLAFWFPTDFQGLTADTAVVRRNARGQEVLALKDPYDVGDRHLQLAKPVLDEVGQHAVQITLTEQGAQLMGKLSEANLPDPATEQHRLLAVIFDGVVLTAPRLISKVSGAAQISGKFSKQQAADMAQALNAGTLPVPIKRVASRTEP